MPMDTDIDHYHVLGLPSGEEGAELTQKEISKAYKLKALVLHPDKNRDDPNANTRFQQLKTSYEILSDEKAKKLFDDLLRVKREQQRRHLERDSKRRKMVSDLERREQDAFSPDPLVKEREEEERISRQLKEEIARIRTMHATKGATATTNFKKEFAGVQKEGANNDSVGLDKEKVLKVKWEKLGEGYSAQKLRELFSKFGEVEDVVINSTKKRGSALVVMASREGVVAATGSVCGNLSNPLLVLPLQPTFVAEFPSSQKPVEPDRLDKVAGAGYQAFEDSVLKKLQKAAEKQK